MIGEEHSGSLRIQSDRRGTFWIFQSDGQTDWQAVWGWPAGPCKSPVTSWKYQTHRNALSTSWTHTGYWKLRPLDFTQTITEQRGEKNSKFTCQFIFHFFGQYMEYVIASELGSWLISGKRDFIKWMCFSLKIMWWRLQPSVTLWYELYS